jgi:hypothetical protein
LSFEGKTRTKDKYRIVYTEPQRLELEKEFIFSKYIPLKRKSELSQTLGLSERQIKIWFQNRRAKERKSNRKQRQSNNKTSTGQYMINNNRSQKDDSDNDTGDEDDNEEEEEEDDQNDIKNKDNNDNNKINIKTTEDDSPKHNFQLIKRLKKNEDENEIEKNKKILTTPTSYSIEIPSNSYPRHYQFTFNNNDVNSLDNQYTSSSSSMIPIDSYQYNQTNQLYSQEQQYHSYNHHNQHHISQPSQYQGHSYQNQYYFDTPATDTTTERCLNYNNYSQDHYQLPPLPTTTTTTTTTTTMEATTTPLQQPTVNNNSSSSFLVANVLSQFQSV